MTDLKPPEVFNEKDFMGNWAPWELAQIANRILTEKLKPWYFQDYEHNPYDKDGCIYNIGKDKEIEDTHVMWSFEPQKLGPVMFELELHSDLQSNIKIDIPQELKGKRLKVTIEEVR